MIETACCLGPIVTSPHRLASQAGLDVLREGGNAAEALVATLSTLAVVYPHMTGLGGDGFWLLVPPPSRRCDPVAIDGAGAAGRLVTPDLYRARGLDRVPVRGPLAANTVPGAVASWHLALAVAGGWGGGRRLPPAALLEQAIHHASSGVPVARSLAADSARLGASLGGLPGFLDAFGETGAGTAVRRERLAATLRALADDGLDAFYRGRLARRIAADLEAVRAPIDAVDLASGGAREVTPLCLRLAGGLDGARVFNLPPPTQGLVSLLILGIADRLRLGEEPGGFAHVHALVEASKRAFAVRDQLIGDPGAMTESPESVLAESWLDRTAATIDARHALPWPEPGPDRGGDTVWCGAVDAEGGMASAINSLFHEFGSGVVLPETGITWQNRGASFTLAPNGPRALAPGRKPFHTLNPAYARFDDGRRMVYGTMGGEGQPQIQAAILTRYALFGTPLQEAVTAPRWLLGRTWGERSVGLRVEADLGGDAIGRLAEAGHAVSAVPPLDRVMGHAGALVLRPDGVREGAADPRSDGIVACV